MNNAHPKRSITPAWITQLAHCDARIPQPAWRLMIGLAEELHQHNLKTGYTRLRLGKHKASELAGCSPRNAQRLIKLLEEIGAIDRVNDGPNAARWGYLTGIPTMKLKRHSGGQHLASVPKSATASKPVPCPTPSEPAVASQQQPVEADQPATPPKDPEEARAEWAKLLERIQAELDAEVFEVFIQPLTPITLSDTCVRLDAPNDIVAEEAKKALEATAAIEGRAVRFGSATPPSQESGLTRSKSSRTSPSPALAQNGSVTARRPVSRKFCRYAAQQTLETYNELAARGRRPTEKLETLFLWVIFHVTYGDGAKDTTNFNQFQALSGALSMLRRGSFEMPTGFQPEVIERYVEAARPILENGPAEIAYDRVDVNLRHFCHQNAA